MSAPLCVRNTLIRLCSSTHPETGERDGPYVMMGANEYTLNDVDALLQALRSLADAARSPMRRGPI